MNSIPFRGNPIEQYDLIIDINSIEYIATGWTINYNEKGIKSYELLKDKKSCVVGVIGNANKGKSFLLQKIAGIQLPSGYNVKTEGLSIKYPEIKEKNIILLDSAGQEAPLIESLFYRLKEKTQEIMEKIENESKSENEEEELDPETKEKIQKEKDEQIRINVIESFARDKILTEFFLQSFILKYSNVLILVVGQLTYFDQKLIHRIKTECKYKKLLIVHNLYNFVEKEQVEEYIENTLMKSLTFKLKKNTIISFENNSENNEKNKYYYSEIFSNEDQEDNEMPDIVHIIMANDSPESPAGQYYNDVAIDFLRNQITCQTDISPFPVIDKIRDFFVQISNKIIDESTPIEKGDVITENRKITLKKNVNEEIQKIELKKCLIDELGTTVFPNRYTPNYRYYTNEDGTRFIIEFEVPEKIEKLKQKVSIVQSNYLFKIEGKKVIEKQKKKIIKSFNTREHGSFTINIFIPLNSINLKSTMIADKAYSNGVVRLEYSLLPQNTQDEDNDE